MDHMSDLTSEKEDDSGIESSAPDSGDSTVYIRINVADAKVQKCLQFHQDDTVWQAKQRVLSTLAKDLRDGMNYGLYQPPQNGKAGKFLDEERPLRDYPLPGPIGFLEFKYKRRVYKLMQVNPRKLKQLHTKANLKQFLSFIRQSNIEQITKFSNKGLDPNFHEHETGETPLTIACGLSKPRNVILSLIAGGAHIDYRTKQSFTPMHKAAIKGNHEAVKTLLDLGASPNYKDSRGLTPLYHCVCHDTNAHVVELLLHDHSVIGIADERGWTEVHHACKNGRVQHLEHLLFYGAEMNAQNSSGNTPLHICGVNNRESCARVLLFRGANKTIQNYANQDASQVAVIAGNSELAAIIKNYRQEDVVPFQEVPKYNEKRRTMLLSETMSTLQRSRSDPRLNVSAYDNSKPPSPALSKYSLPHYVNNGTNSETSSLYRVGYDSDSPRSMSISSAGSLSGTRNSVEDDTVVVKRQTLAALVTGDPENAPRTVVLQKGKSGFGFVLRGAKSNNQNHNTNFEFTPTAEFPALQYLDRVDKGSMADKAGLKSGDFLLEINGENVINATHEKTVQMIKHSGDTLAMKVVTVKRNMEGMEKDSHMDGTMTLPSKKRAAPAPPKRGPHTSLTTTRAKSMIDGLAALEESDSKMNDAAMARGIDTTNRTASIKSRGAANRLSTVTLGEIFRDENYEQHDNPTKPVIKTYASPAEMRARKQGNHSAMNRAQSHPNLTPALPEEEEYSRHITTVQLHDSPAGATVYENSNDKDTHERLYAVPFKGGHSDTNSNDSVSRRQRVPFPNESPPPPPSSNVVIPPPPAHPPPAPPDYGNTGEVVRINTSSNGYANVADQIAQQKAGSAKVESSFRPGITAKLSKEPIPVPQVKDSSRNSSIRSSNSHSSMSSAADSRKSQVFYEPAPDYDIIDDRHLKRTDLRVNTQHNHHSVEEVTSPSVRDVRQSWAQKEAEVTGVKRTPPAPPSPAQKTPIKEENSMSAFGNAIKMAAVARESRLSDKEKEELTNGTPKSSESQRQRKGTAPPPPPPPPPGPPPPVAENSPVVIKKSPMPQHVRKELEEKKKQDDSHAALMSAIAKRRTFVENANMDQLAENIENRVQKSNKIQSTTYKGNSTEKQKPAVAPKAKKEEKDKKPEEENMVAKQPTVSNSNDKRDSTDFIAMAEKARQDWLLTRQNSSASQLDSPKGVTTQVKDGSVEREITSLQKGPNVNMEPKNSTNVGDLAAIIAQKAAAKQQNGSLPTHVNTSNVTRKVYTSNGSSSNSVSSSRSGTVSRESTPQRDNIKQTVAINGATTDHSSTEAPQKSPKAVIVNDQLPSVSDRMKMFEKKNKNSSPNGFDLPPPVGEQSDFNLDDIPPPMVPPPSEYNSGVEYSNMNGHEPVGWLINGSPTKNNPRSGIQGKIDRQYSSGGVTVNGNGTAGITMVMNEPYVQEDIDVDVVPPPPIFDTMDQIVQSGGVSYNSKPQVEDSVSLVSSVSTLSTLSSMGPEDHSRSSNYAAPSIPSSTGNKEPLYSTEIAAPPQFDGNQRNSAGYVHMTNEPEHLYEELGNVPEFIPPPDEFGTSPPKVESGVTSLRNALKAGQKKSYPALPQVAQKTFQSKNIEQWSPNDVCDWLESIDMAEHVNSFRSNNVTGKQLLKFVRSDWIRLGINQAVQRLNIELAIKKESTK